MSKSLGLSMGVILFTAVSAQTSPQYYSQCGGIGWAGPTTCPSGWSCNYFNDWYSQCIPGIVSTAPPTTATNPGSIVTSVIEGVATLAPGYSFVHTAVGSTPTA